MKISEARANGWTMRRIMGRFSRAGVPLEDILVAVRQDAEIPLQPRPDTTQRRLRALARAASKFMRQGS